MAPLISLADISSLIADSIAFAEDFMFVLWPFAAIVATIWGVQTFGNWILNRFTQ